MGYSELNYFSRSFTWMFFKKDQRSEIIGNLMMHCFKITQAGFFFLKRFILVNRIIEGGIPPNETSFGYIKSTNIEIVADFI